MFWLYHSTDSVTYRLCYLNSLPNNKILDQSKFKKLTDNKIDATKKLKFVLGMVENILGKGETAGNQHFLLFLQCFQKASFSRKELRILTQRAACDLAV